MIVKVRESNIASGSNIQDHYVQLDNYSDDFDRDKVRQIAFRFIFKRNERDFNELMHATSLIEITQIPQATADFVLSM